MLTMTKIKKYKLFINPIEEEKWINDQLVKGYKLIKLSIPGIYTFIESDIDYVLRIDCQTIYSLKNIMNILLYMKISDGNKWVGRGMVPIISIG